MSALLERSKQSGLIPPALTSLEVYLNEDAFDSDVLSKLDANGMFVFGFYSIFGIINSINC